MLQCGFDPVHRANGSPIICSHKHETVAGKDAKLQLITNFAGSHICSERPSRPRDPDGAETLKYGDQSGVLDIRLLEQFVMDQIRWHAGGSPSRSINRNGSDFPSSNTERG